MKPIFEPADRLIFEYPDFETGEFRYADPLDIQFKLLILTKNRFDDLVDMQRPNKNVDSPRFEDEIKAMSAKVELAKAMITALGLEMVSANKKGVTLTHGFKLLQEYMDFIETKKEKAESLQKSQNPLSAQLSPATTDIMSPTPLINLVENSRQSTTKR